MILPRSLAIPLVASAAIHLSPIDSLAQTIRTYDVNFTGATLTLDGVRGPGEWDNASEATGGFRLLRLGGTPANEDITFQMQWTDDALYLIIETDRTFWGKWDGGVQFGFDQYNILIDPNVDDEPNQSSFDGYHIAIWQTDGLITRFGDELDELERTTFLEARANSNFGNGAGWNEPRELDWVSNHGDFGGVVELCIPWTDFNADEGNADGLFHPMAPEFDDVWFLNVAKGASNGELPSWNWTSGQFFADRPHGEITFTGIRAPFIVTNFEYNEGDPSTAKVTWNSISGRSYAVDRSSDPKLIIWDELDDGVVAEGESTTFCDDDVPAGGSAFYRVREL